MSHTGPRRVRFVTHFDVSDGDVKKAINSLSKIMAAYAPVVVKEPPKPPPSVTVAMIDEEEALPAVVMTSTPADQPKPDLGMPSPLVSTPAPAPLEQSLSTSPQSPSPNVMDPTATLVPTATNASATASSPPPEPVVDVFEEVTIVGVSTSEQGFVVVLLSPESRRAIKVVVTPIDPMSAGLDVHQVRTSHHSVSKVFY